MSIAEKNGDVNSFNVCKIEALEILTGYLYMFNSNPYDSGSLPYNIELISKYINRIHISGMPVYFYMANSLLLDYYFPKWRLYVDSSIWGILLKREDMSVSNWRKSVINRDKKCIECGSLKNLHAHHIASWSKYPDLRISISNGVTLCNICHSKRHPELSKALFNQGGINA